MINGLIGGVLNVYFHHMIIFEIIEEDKEEETDEAMTKVQLQR